MTVTEEMIDSLQETASRAGISRVAVNVLYNTTLSLTPVQRIEVAQWLLNQRDES